MEEEFAHHHEDTGLNESHEEPCQKFGNEEIRRGEGREEETAEDPLLAVFQNRDPSVDHDHHHDELDRGARNGMVETGGNKGEGLFGEAALDGDPLVKLRRILEKTLQIFVSVEDQLGDGHGDGLDQGRLRLSGRLSRRPFPFLELQGLILMGLNTGRKLRRNHQEPVVLRGLSIHSYNLQERTLELLDEELTPTPLILVDHRQFGLHVLGISGTEEESEDDDEEHREGQCPEEEGLVADHEP